MTITPDRFSVTACNHVVSETEGYHRVNLLAKPDRATYSQHGSDSPQKSRGVRAQAVGVGGRKETNIFSTQNRVENGNLHQVEFN